MPPTWFLLRLVCACRCVTIGTSSLEKVIFVLTRKLFHSDAFQTNFSATVLSCLESADGWEIILDQTCFYAEAGGQPSDSGVLGGLRLSAVREEDDGTVIHTVPGPLQGEIEGEIDWVRRLDHMEQHTGQHLLSGAFERLLDAETLSWHLGSSSCTVDLSLDSLTQEQANQVELECNRMIRSGVDIITHRVDQAGLMKLPLRKPPKVTENIRVVEIGGYDWSACAGTHVNKISELGLLKIKSWERNKKSIRVEFLVGGRALADYMEMDQITRELCRSLSIGLLELPRFADRAQEDISNLRKQVRTLQERLLEIEAAELVAGAKRIAQARVVRQVFGGRPVDEIKLLAAKVSAHPGTVALFGTRGAIPQLVFHRSVDLRLDLGGVIKHCLPMIGGRGGGSPIQAQGGGSRPDGLEPALDLAAQKIAELLR